MLKYIDNAKEWIWTALGRSAHDIMEQVGVIAVAKYMVHGSGLPQEKLTIRTGALAKAVQDFNYNNSFENDSLNNITVERSVNSKYAAIHEYGGKIPLSEIARRAMFARLRASGQYNRDKARIGQGKKAFADMPPRPYIRPTIEVIDWIKIVKKNIRDVFKDIRTEIVIDSR